MEDRMQKNDASENDSAVSKLSDCPILKKCLRGGHVQKLSVSKSMILKPKIEARGVFQSEKRMEFRCQIQFSNF